MSILRAHLRCRDGAYPDGSLDSDSKLLVQPYRDLGACLKELEDVVDGWQEHLSTSSSAASAHCDVVGGMRKLACVGVRESRAVW